MSRRLGVKEELKKLEHQLLNMWEKEWSERLPVRPYPLDRNIHSAVWFVGVMPSTSGEKLRIENPNLPNYASTDTDRWFARKRKDFGFPSAYLTDIVKAGAQRKRLPTGREIYAFWPYLERELALLTPRLIIALGRDAHALLLDLNLPPQTVVTAITHPAAAFRWPKHGNSFDRELAAARARRKKMGIA